MKLRHAATLALVGWYLMVPPIPQTWTGDPDLPSVAIIDTCNPDAPLSEWRGKGEFEQLSECRAAQEKEPDATKEILEKFDEQSRSMGHPSVGNPAGCGGGRN